MTEWSVAVTTRRPDAVADLDDAVAGVLDALADHAPAASYSPEAITVRIAVDADDAADAGTRGIGTVVNALGSVGWPVEVRDLQVTEWGLFESSLEEPTHSEVVGITEIAALLGTSRQRASELARSRRFPAPLADLAAGPIWAKPAVERFVDEWERKPGRPRSDRAAGGRSGAERVGGQATA